MQRRANFRAALNGDPGNLGLLREFIRVLHGRGREEECLVLLDAALAASPSDATLHCDRGLILSHLARYEEALAAFDRGIAFDPDNANARYGRALVNLLLGRLHAGWPDYRARESLRSGLARDSMAACGHGYRAFPLPDDLEGRRVLVVGDQGLGDELFFLRFMGRLKARGAAIVYQTDSRLVPMLTRAQIADRVIAREEATGTHDFRVSVGDLPFLTEHTEDEPLPSSVALRPLPHRLSEIRERLLAFGPGPYTGVTWRAGSAGAARRLSKAAPADSVAAAVAGLPGRVVILQRGPAAGEIETFARVAGRPVLDLSALNADLEAMLALCAAMESYVSVSNTNVHLREACGRSSSVLVPFPSEFRWMADGSESPWFPGSALYRQRADGDWSDAFSELTRDLHSDLPAFRVTG